MEYQYCNNNYLNGHKMSMDYTADLNYFYTNEVQLRRAEIKKAVEITLPIIDEILKDINQRDPRFSRQRVCVGSYWAGLKVEKADEFDVSVPLNISDKFVWTESKDCYYKVDPNDSTKVVRSGVPLPPSPTGYSRTQYSSPSDPLWKNAKDMIFDDYLIPMYVRNTFKKLLREAVRNLDLREKVQVSRKEQGPALTVYIQPPGHPNMISVDFAPVHQTRSSFTSRMNWPRPSARWPTQEKIQMIKEVGVNDVPKKDLDWYLSFAEAEKELIKEIDEDGGNRKKLHRTMKKLAHDVWCPGQKPVLSSYILKNVLFWECEEFPRAKDWDNDALWVRFLSLTRRLRNALQQRHLPLYFYPDVDLLKTKDTTKLDTVIGNIDKFLHNPVRYLRPE